jgi:carbon storage regulator
MLVLSRKKNETIIIVVGEFVIEITVIEIRGDKVRLGCAADTRVTIHRREVWEAIQEEARRRNAAGQPADAHDDDRGNKK